MTVAIQVKILTAVCGRCGTDVIGDNMGTGRAWQHLNGVDDHPIIFGTPAPPVDLTARPASLDELQDVIDAEEFPPPGTPRTATDDDMPLGARRMVKIATDAGFETVAKIVRGPIPMARHHDERGYRYVESLLVGFRHADGRIAIAIWERQETEEGFGFKWSMFPGSGGLSASAELKAYLR